MEETTKKILRREARNFAVYFVIVLLVSRYSSTSRTVVDGVVYSRFFLDLFFLHMTAWVMVYALIRGAVWAVKSWIKG
jgi:hypothetical protein